jgi:hypothetical protein
LRHCNHVSDVSDDDVALGVRDGDWFSEIGNVSEDSKSDNEKTEESSDLANPFETDELAAFVSSNPVLKSNIQMELYDSGVTCHISLY